MLSLPTISIRRCLHRSEYPIEESARAIGIQVFLEHEESGFINRDPGCFSWELSHPFQANFLDARRIDSQVLSEVLQWGYLNGLITYQPMIQVSFRDSESDLDVTHEFDPHHKNGTLQANQTFQLAKEFHSKAVITKSPRAHATNRLIAIIGQHIHHCHTVDALLPLFANDSIQSQKQSICGVWWSTPHQDNPGMNGILLTKDIQAWTISEITNHREKMMHRAVG